MTTNQSVKDAKQTVDLWIAITVLGSLWGLAEVVLGGAIKAAGIPCASAILVGVGMGIMGIAIGAFRKPLMLAGVALFAVLCKQLVVPIMHVSVMCKANSCLAVALEALALAGAVTLATHRLETGDLAKTATGLSSGLLAAAAFHFAGMRLAPCQYLLSFSRPGGFAAFMLAEGILWGAFSGILFPVGHAAGRRLARTVLALRTSRRRIYYAASTVLLISCWMGSALAIAAGS